MNIKLFKLSDTKLSPDVIKEDNIFINELNDSLFDDDYFLDSNCRNYLFPVVMVESEKYINSFNKIKDKLVNPVIILSGKDRKAFKGALELNAKLMMDGYHPLVVKGSDAEDATIIIEVARVMQAKNKIIGANIAIIGNSNEKHIVSKDNIGEISKKHNVNILKIGNTELEDAINKVKPTNLHHKAILNKLFNHSDYQAFNKLYSALMFLVEKYKLSGISLNVEFDTHFLYPLASLLNEKGVSFILENDLNGLLSLMLLNALNDSIAVYAEMVNIDLSKNDIILSSNSVPFSFINKEGSIDNGDISLMKFAYDNKHFLAVMGKITSSRLYKGEVEITVHMEEREMFELFREAIGGTIAFSYGDSIANIFAYDNIIYFDNKK